MKRLIMAGLAGMLIGNVAHASLLDGKTLGFAIHYPTIDAVTSESLNGNYVVAAGPEISVPLVTGDFSDSNLRADFHGALRYGSMPFVGWEFFDVNGDISAFTAVAFNAATNLAGLGADRITFDDDHIWVNLQGLTAYSSTIVSIDINAVPASVPEPGAAYLLGMGLAAMGLVRRRPLKS